MRLQRRPRALPRARALLPRPLARRRPTANAVATAESAITVESLPAQTTPPTEKQVGDKRGVSAWTFDLAPGAEKEIKVAYRIKWPGDREVTYAPQPGPGPQPMPRPLN